MDEITPEIGVACRPLRIEMWNGFFDVDQTSSIRRAILN
jgi:hypothetical protein